jgi:CheY-like chemotaxis protein
MAALAAHEAGRFDLVLMGLHMPEMGGFEATALIRQREALGGCHTPIVAMTARAMKGDRERCLEAGMDGYIPKPVSEDALWMAIKAAVATSASAPEVTGNVRLSECGDERTLLDQEWLLARVGGDAGLLSELVDLFLLEYPRLLDTLGEAVTKEDAPTLIEAAHALKGSLAYFGDSAALEAVSQLEAMGNTGNLVDSPRALDRLVVELDRLGPLLRQLVMHQAVSED